MYTVYYTHLSVRPFCTYINMRIGRVCAITESCDCFNFKAKVRPTTVTLTTPQLNINMKSLGTSYYRLITKYRIHHTRAVLMYT